MKREFDAQMKKARERRMLLDSEIEAAEKERERRRIEQEEHDRELWRKMDKWHK